MIRTTRLAVLARLPTPRPCSRLIARWRSSNCCCVRARRSRCARWLSGPVSTAPRPIACCVSPSPRLDRARSRISGVPSRPALSGSGAGIADWAGFRRRGKTNDGAALAALSRDRPPRRPRQPRRAPYRKSRQSGDRRGLVASRDPRDAARDRSGQGVARRRTGRGAGGLHRACAQSGPCPDQPSIQRHSAPRSRWRGRRGYSIDDGESSPGVRCLAVAIRGVGGSPLFAISLTGPSAASPRSGWRRVCRRCSRSRETCRLSSVEKRTQARRRWRDVAEAAAEGRGMVIEQAVPDTARVMVDFTQMKSFGQDPADPRARGRHPRHRRLWADLHRWSFRRLHGQSRTRRSRSWSTSPPSRRVRSPSPRQRWRPIRRRCGWRTC